MARDLKLQKILLLVKGTGEGELQAQDAVVSLLRACFLFSKFCFHGRQNLRRYSLDRKNNDNITTYSSHSFSKYIKEFAYVINYKE